MLFNSDIQISSISFKRFVWILPKIQFFLFFKAVISLSISLTPVLAKSMFWFAEIFHLIAIILGWFLNFLIAISTRSLHFLCFLENINIAWHWVIWQHLKKVLNTSDKSKLSDIILLFFSNHICKKIMYFKVFNGLKHFPYLTTLTFSSLFFVKLTTKISLLFV